MDVLVLVERSAGVPAFRVSRLPRRHPLAHAAALDRLGNLPRARPYIKVGRLPPGLHLVLCHGEAGGSPRGRAVKLGLYLASGVVGLVLVGLAPDGANLLWMVFHFGR